MFSLNLIKPFWLFILFSLVGAFWPSAANALGAHRQCSNVFMSEFAGGGLIEVLPSAKPLAESAETYVHLITTANGYLGKLQPPKETRIKVTSSYRSSVFNGADFTINFGLRTKEERSLHPAKQSVILLHEYGHAVFEKNLIVQSQEYNLLRDANFRIESDLQDSHALLAELRKNKTPQDIMELARQEHAAVKKREQEIIQKMMLRSAYHEVFADVFSYAVTGNPRAHAKVISDTTNLPKEHSVEDLQLRDMTSGRNHLQRQSWENHAEMQIKVIGNFHMAFLPVQWEIWHLTKTKIKSEQYRRELPEKLFKVLLKNFQEDLRQTPKEMGPSGLENIERLNQKIINDLRATL